MKTLLICILGYMGGLLGAWADLPTIIQSDSLDVKTMPEGNIFYFKNNVCIQANDLEVTCDLLEVHSQESSPNGVAGLAQVGAIELIIATGQVHIKQAGRIATAGRAEIIPTQGKLVLSEDPVVIDEQGQVRGYRITLLKNESRAIVEGQPGAARPKVILPSLSSMGAKPSQAPTQPAVQPTASGVDIKAAKPQQTQPQIHP